MAAEVINGKECAIKIHHDLKQKVKDLKRQNITPGLGVILVGEDPASHTYVQSKAKACENLGFYSEIIKLPAHIDAENLKQHVKNLNNRSEIHGILVQLPLPEHICEKEIIDLIDPNKDVDGFTPINVGNLVIKDNCFIPCTPKGILKLIKETGIEIRGKHAVIIGRSNIVGKPMSMLLLHEDATVTMCHSQTKNLSSYTKQADILIVAVGKAHFVTKDFIKPGAIVIDVGINRLQDGRLAGDVFFDEVKEVAGYITPVPRGVGPMTIAMLMENTVEATYKLNNL